MCWAFSVCEDMGEKVCRVHSQEYRLHTYGAQNPEKEEDKECELMQKMVRGYDKCAHKEREMDTRPYSLLRCRRAISSLPTCLPGFRLHNIPNCNFLSLGKNSTGKHVCLGLLPVHIPSNVDGMTLLIDEIREEMSM